MNVKIFINRRFFESVDFQTLMEGEGENIIKFGGGKIWMASQNLDMTVTTRIKPYIDLVKITQTVRYTESKLKKYRNKYAEAMLVKTDQSDICELNITGRHFDRVKKFYHKVISDFKIVKWTDIYKKAPVFPLLNGEIFSKQMLVKN